MFDPQVEFPDDEEFDAGSSGDIQASSEEGDLLDWGGGELEQAYLKAMMALEASEAELPEISACDSSPPADPETGPQFEQIVEVRPIVDLVFRGEPTKSSLTELLPAKAVPRQEEAKSEPLTETRLTPRQILESCLFVGGSALASGKLASVLRGDFDSDFIDREIDELNRLYAAENRPYEIRLGEGGYRLTLRDEYERIRYKVYGLGPKEVRLSQEALEVLAIVAYHQPVKQSVVEEMGKQNCGAVLRQLVRRELLSVDRDPEQPRDVSYKTTPRFLTLFGIRNLDELPRHEQVGYK